MSQAVIANRSVMAAVNVVSWRDIPFRTTVHQRFDFSCGSAALASLLTYHYATPTDETQAFAAMWKAGDQAQIRRAGFSLLDMKRYLVSQGFAAQGYRITLDELMETQQPLIVLLETKGFRHFVVIKGVAGATILIGDPIRGLLRMDRAAFATEWKGVVLAINAAPGGREPRFNDPAEWRPWAKAPTSAVGPATIGDTTSWLPRTYQITAQTVLPVPAGIHP